MSDSGPPSNNAALSGLPSSAPTVPPAPPVPPALPVPLNPPAQALPQSGSIHSSAASNAAAVVSGGNVGQAGFPAYYHGLSIPGYGYPAIGNHGPPFLQMGPFPGMMYQPPMHSGVMPYGSNMLPPYIPPNYTQPAPGFVSGHHGLPSSDASAIAGGQPNPAGTIAMAVDAYSNYGELPTQHPSSMGAAIPPNTAQPVGPVSGAAVSERSSTSSRIRARGIYTKPALKEGALRASGSGGGGTSDGISAIYTASLSALTSTNGGPDRQKPQEDVTDEASKKKGTHSAAKAHAAATFESFATRDGILMNWGENRNTLKDLMTLAYQKANAAVKPEVTAVPNSDIDRQINGILNDALARLKDNTKFVVYRAFFNLNSTLPPGMNDTELTAFRVKSLTLVEQSFPTFLDEILATFNIDFPENFKINQMAFTDGPNVTHEDKPLSPVPFGSLAIREIFVHHLFGGVKAMGHKRPQDFTSPQVRKFLSVVLMVALNVFDELQTGEYQHVKLEPAIYLPYQAKFLEILDAVLADATLGPKLTKMLDDWLAYGRRVARYRLGPEKAVKAPRRKALGDISFVKNYGKDAHTTFSVKELLAKLKAKEFATSAPDFLPSNSSDFLSDPVFMGNYSPETGGVSLSPLGNDAFGEGGAELTQIWHSEDKDL